MKGSTSLTLLLGRRGKKHLSLVWLFAKQPMLLEGRTLKQKHAKLVQRMGEGSGGKQLESISGKMLVKAGERGEGLCRCKSLKWGIFLLVKHTHTHLFTNAKIFVWLWQVCLKIQTITYVREGTKFKIWIYFANWKSWRRQKFRPFCQNLCFANISLKISNSFMFMFLCLKKVRLEKIRKKHSYKK